MFRDTNLLSFNKDLDFAQALIYPGGGIDFTRSFVCSRIINPCFSKVVAKEMLVLRLHVSDVDTVKLTVCPSVVLLNKSDTPSRASTLLARFDSSLVH